MVAYKAVYSNGTVRFLEPPPNQTALRERQVVVVFLDDMADKEERQYVSAGDLLKLSGIVNIGGDAVKDTEELYNE